jgi:hypothetical protein
VSLLVAATPVLVHATTISVYYDSVPVNGQTPSSAVYGWVPTGLAAAKAGTFEQFAHGTYPDSTNMSIDDETIDMTGSVGTGKALFFLFDVQTEVRDAANFRVRELLTHSFSAYGTYDQNWDDITTGGLNAATWQPIYGIDNATLATGHVYQGYWWYWDKAADVDTYSYQTAVSFYVEYSTDGGASWSAPASVTLDVVPEPGTLALLATACLGLLPYAWRRR